MGFRIRIRLIWIIVNRKFPKNQWKNKKLSDLNSINNNIVSKQAKMAHLIEIYEKIAIYVSK